MGRARAWVAVRLSSGLLVDCLDRAAAAISVARLLGTWFAGVLAPALVGMIIFGLEGGGDEDGPFLFFALMVAVPTIISLATIGAFERRKRRS